MLLGLRGLRYKEVGTLFRGVQEAYWTMEEDEEGLRPPCASMSQNHT